ncbi:MAG: hypothetical protein HYW48_12610, partial [Deltaproteobacteria bacterium]|nr:hypothetical protein [Deltaproteobacteria bacterium]
AIRKLWAMQGLRKQFGTDVLDKAAQGASSFRDLKQRSKYIKADLNQQMSVGVSRSKEGCRGTFVEGAPAFSLASYH